MSVYSDNPRAVGVFVVISCDDTTGRIWRGAQIRAERRRYERDHHVQLSYVSVSYSETPGFLSRTAIRYRINR